MLAKKFRLTANEVKKVLSTGSTHRSRLFIIRAQTEEVTTDQPQAVDHQFAVTISKKLSKKAVVRNLLRRQIQEIIRLNKNFLKNNVKLKIVLIPKHNCLTQKYKEIETDVIYILQNIEKWLNI